ncbi:MAG: neutral/alkaline non-lysosomal ceramidase N-terminal domain-containing protein [Myxococcota bacterium]|nr:neutral/alkaline non-lysosomal ceramidase N-terminal domain-containing protein [Myxococcota bacterium]
MARRRLLRAVGPALLLAVGGAYALASYNWCGRWLASPPAIVQSQAGEGPLRAGAGRVALAPPYPVVRAGYGPPRSSVSSAEIPLHARALILEQGQLRVAVVSLELLLVPGPLTEAIREQAASLQIDELWVTATHSHSAVGAFDQRLLGQVAATGRFRPEVQQAVVDAAVASLRLALESLVPARLELGSGELGPLVRSRVPSMDPDRRLTRLRVLGPDRPVGEVVVISAHATMEPRLAEALSPDYPGWLSQQLEGQGGVALVLMGAVGNSSTAGEAEPEVYAQKVSQQLGAVALSALEPQLAFARVRASLPRPDASRLVPSLVRRAGENFLCTSAPRTVEVAVLQLGALRLAAVPGEVTTAAAGAFELETRARVVSLVNDYVGYVEAPELVAQHQGESRRQYFGPELSPRLGEATRLAASELQRPR